MARKILGVVAGLALWLISVTVAGAMLRVSWPAYASVADTLAFTVPMLIARLSIGGVATIAAGAVASAIAPRSMIARLVPGVLLLLAFIPVHISLWDKFPVWYHL